MQNTHFAKHWGRNYTCLSPTNYKMHPSGTKILFWAQFINNEDIWLPLYDNNNPDKKYFFCSKCEKWLIYGDTVSNIKRHLKSHLDKSDYHSSSNNSQNLDERLITDSIIAQSLTKFILLNGLPFRLIEDDNLKTIVPGLKNRKALSLYCKAISIKIIDSIKKESTFFSNICISIDEWKDLSTRSYLGVTAQAVSEEKNCILYSRDETNNRRGNIRRGYLSYSSRNS